MDNIDKLQRQQKVLWPEFSWQSEPAQADKKRCFQMFAPDISRIGYTNEGRVYSIICPQQGIWIKDILCLNVEVTVTGQRGWVDQPVGKLAADMTVKGKIWFTPLGDLANILTHDLHAQKSDGLLESVSGQSGAPMSEAEMNFRNLLEAHKANAAG